MGSHYQQINAEVYSCDQHVFLQVHGHTKYYFYFPNSSDISNYEIFVILVNLVIFVIFVFFVVFVISVIPVIVQILLLF